MSDDCPHCHGTGFALKTRAAGVVTAVRCACEELGRSEHLLRATRVPRRYAHCDFESFLPQPNNKSHERAKRLSQQWVDLWPAVKHGLLFLGPPGTGKTHLAVAVATELAQKKGAQVLFYEQRELLKKLQGTFETGAEQRESEILGSVQQVEILVLDDLGAGRTTAWARDVLHDIIVQRYNDEKLIIITSNLKIGDEPESGLSRQRRVEGPLTLRDRLGDALISRLYEMCKLVPLQGEDFRITISQHGRKCN